LVTINMLMCYFVACIPGLTHYSTISIGDKA
jgi:hypothetical protein